MKARVLILGAVSLLLNGCTATSPMKKEGIIDKSVPGDWKSSAVELGGVDSNWIASFKDRKLNALVDEAEKRNYDLQIAAVRVEKARINARLAGANLYPQVTSGLNSSRRKQSFIGFPIGEGEGSDGQPPGAMGGNSSKQFSRF